MLRGINPVLTSDPLKILWDMGHGDELVITDAHYPAHSKCPDLVIDTAGVDVAPILEGIAPLFELDPEVPPAMIQDTEKGSRRSTGRKGLPRGTGLRRRDRAHGTVRLLRPCDQGIRRCAHWRA